MASARELTVALVLRLRDEASGLLGKLRQGFISLASTLGAAFNRFTALGAGGIFAASVKSAGDFEAALAKVQARSGASAEEMQRLRQAAETIGPAANRSTIEAAQGLEALTAAGLTTDQAIANLPATLNLATIESINLDQAASILTSSMTVAGVAMDQGARAADALAAASSASDGTVVDFAEALQEGGAAARNYGLSLEETLTYLAAFAKSGLKGSEAGTALNAMLRELSNPASKASQELNKLGITSRNLGEVIDGLKQAGFAGQAAIQAMGDEGRRGIDALRALGAQGVEPLRQAIVGTTGTAQQMAATIGNTLPGAVDGVLAATGRLAQTLAQPFLEPLIKGLKTLKATLLEASGNEGLLRFRDAVVNGFQQVQTSAATVVTSLGGIFDSVKTAVSSFIGAFQLGPVTDDLTKVKDATLELSTAISKQLPDAVTVGVTAANVFAAGWNGATSVINALSAGVLKLAEYSARALAEIEEQAAKVGLGSQENADRLRKNAEELAITAADMAGRSVESYERTRLALERLKQGLSDVKIAQEQVNESNRLSADFYIQYVKQLTDVDAKIAVLKAGYRNLAEAGRDTSTIEQALATALAATTQATQATTTATQAANQATQQQATTATQAAQATTAFATAQASVASSLQSAKEAVTAAAAAYEALRSNQQASAEQTQQAAIRYGQAIDALLAVLERQLATQQQGLATEQQLVEAKKIGAEAAARVAEATNQETLATEKSVEAKQLAVKQAELSLKSAQAELVVLQQKLQIQREAAQFTDGLSAAEQEALTTLQASIAAQKAQIEVLKAKVGAAKADVEVTREQAQAQEQQTQALTQQTKVIQQQQVVVEKIQQSWQMLLPMWDALTENTQAYVKSLYDVSRSANTLNAALRGINQQAIFEQDLLDRIERAKAALEGTGFEAQRAQFELNRLAFESQSWGEMASTAGEQALQAIQDYSRELQSATEQLQELIANQRRDLGDQRAYEEYQHQQRLNEIRELATVGGEASRLAQEALANENRLYEQQLDQINRIQQRERERPTTTATAPTTTPTETAPRSSTSNQTNNFDITIRTLDATDLERIIRDKIIPEINRIMRLSA